MALVVGCDELDSKKTGGKPNDAAQKSFERTRDATGVAPPDMLQVVRP
jgi:hypothetical protein